jgi:hypothetical protein
MKIFDNDFARQQLLAIGSPAALALVENAWKWGGDFAQLLDEAEAGGLRGPAKLANGFRKQGIGWREQQQEEAAHDAAEAARKAKEDARVQASREAAGGGTSADAGDPGNEDAAWGSSSSDGWRVD